MVVGAGVGGSDRGGCLAGGAKEGSQFQILFITDTVLHLRVLCTHSEHLVHW